MEQYFDIRLTDDQLRAISSVGLAHMGDAVFEILVRGWLCAHGKATGKGLHQATIRLVCAESQAQKAQQHPAAFDGGGAGGFQAGTQCPGALRAVSRQPCPICRGHRFGGAAGLAVPAGAKRADQ